MPNEKGEQVPAEAHEHTGESLREIQEKQEEELQEKIRKFEDGASRKEHKAEELEKEKEELPRRDPFNQGRLNQEISEARMWAIDDRKQAEELREKLDALDKRHAGRSVGRKLQE